MSKQLCLRNKSVVQGWGQVHPCVRKEELVCYILEWVGCFYWGPHTAHGYGWVSAMVYQMSLEEDRCSRPDKINYDVYCPRLNKTWHSSCGELLRQILVQTQVFGSWMGFGHSTNLSEFHILHFQISNRMSWDISENIIPGLKKAGITGT